MINNQPANTYTSNNFSSSYRVKFLKDEFLNIVKISKPEFIFHVRRIYFFAFQGFIAYTFKCSRDDFNDRETTILEAVEFSNKEWSEPY